MFNLLKIVSSIDGFKAVSLIAVETNIEQSVVKESIQNLLYMDMIMLVPIIQYSSMFVKTPKLAEFYSSSDTQTASILFVQMDPGKQKKKRIPFQNNKIDLNSKLNRQRGPAFLRHFLLVQPVQSRVHHERHHRAVRAL